MGTVNGSHGVMAPLILLPRFQRMYLPAYGKEGTGELAVVVRARPMRRTLV